MSKISIILNVYDPTPWQRHMTMACLATIRKFTDQPYEIIVVDNEPKFPIRDEYKVLNLDKENVITNTKNQTAYYSYNQGAAQAHGDYLVFMQNDVFCHERTINKLVEYLEGYDVAYPQQIPITRDQVNQLKVNEIAPFGWRDAGMLAITKEAFKKTGGWDDRFNNLLGEAAFYKRIDNAGLSWTCQTTAIITHIMAGNNLMKDKELYAKQMDKDAKLLEEYK